MREELCPRCGVLRTMDRTAYRSTERDSRGKDRPVITIVNCCQHCGSFVRSENVREVKMQWNRTSTIHSIRHGGVVRTV